MNPVPAILAVIPVSRARAVLPAALRLFGGAVVGVFVVTSYRGLHFVPSGASNRITDYALAVALLPVAVGGLYLLLTGLRWLLLVLWPGNLEIVGSSREILFALGPFGRHRFDAPRLRIRYPYECDPDEGEYSVEAFEDPQLQERTRVPRIDHPDHPGRVDRLIERFAAPQRQALVDAMQPFIAALRENRASAAGGSP